MGPDLLPLSFVSLVGLESLEYMIAHAPVSFNGYVISRRKLSLYKLKFPPSISYLFSFALSLILLQADMPTEKDQLTIFFFPFLAHGHMIPQIDMAKLFASRGAKTAVVTTPLNVPFISKPIERARELGLDVDIKVIKFDCEKVGLPEGAENVDLLPPYMNGTESTEIFFPGTRILQEPLEQLLEECRPDCIVADMLYPWANEAAAKFGIPRLLFHALGLFSICVQECMRLYEPHKTVSSDSEPFVVPHLPGEITLTRDRIANFLKTDDLPEIRRLMNDSKESELKCFGMIMNGFYEMEGVYADFYRNFLGRRAWFIGPLSLFNKGNEDKTVRGKQASINEHECLHWLDSQKPNSVIYICFGSMCNFNDAQLIEIAAGLEASGQPFIWVVRKYDTSERGKETWLPEGFERRTEGQGLIIRGWAPQLLILEHPALGAFVTHCGWNGILEGVTAGVPMVTWPVAVEQFYNEQLVTHVLKVGIRVGAEKWKLFEGDSVSREKIEKAVREILVGDGAEERRSRVKALSEKAKRAVQKGGSSDSELNALIEELKAHRLSKP